MARTISDEQIKLSVIINGDPAQKELHDVEKSIRNLNKQQTELRKEKQLLEKAGQKETERYKLITQSLKENTDAIAKNKLRMAELQKEIGLTGLTMGQLRSKATALRVTLNNLIPGSQDYKRYEAELNQVNSRLSELRGNAKNVGFSIGRLADGFNRYAALGASVIATLTGVALSISKIIDISGKLSDAQSDVQKTTGMTKDEVDELTKSFAKLDTRTSRIDLLKIAEQAGRIGIAKDEIQDFVSIMDKASVALGDSFSGGVEEVASKLGKLKFLFQETKDMDIENAYNAIGSAINDLGANGVATEATMTEFATRLGSLPDSLKPSIREALALGAAFEESGIEAEVSSRAYNIFMKQASTESGKFAQVMGVSTKSIENMINTNPLEFMLKFAQGMRGMDATETAKTLDFLGVNADGANKVIGAMGNNMGRFKELIDLSNSSFELGTSLIGEFTVKNENLAANLEKIKKTVMGWFSSETFLKWLSSSILWFAKFIGASEDASKEVEGFRNKLIFLIKAFAVLLVSYISYNAAIRLTMALTKSLIIAQNLLNVAQQRGTIINGILKSGYLLLNTVYFLLTGNINKATASMRLFNITTKLNPLGLLLGVLAAAITSFLAFSNTIKKTISTQETFANQQRELSNQVSKQNAQTKSSIESLVQMIKSENISLESRKKAYNDLIKINPIFNGFLKDEKFNINGLIKVYSEYIKQLDQVAYAKKFSQLNEKNIEKEISAQQKLFDAEQKLLNKTKERNNYLQAQRNSTTLNGVKNRELVEGIKDAEAEVKLAKSNLITAKKIVSQTNQFREKNIKDLENTLKIEEKALAKITDQKSTSYKVAFLKLQGTKAKLQSLLGSTNTATPETATATSNFNTPADKPKTKTKYDDSYLDEEKRRAEELIKLKNQNNLDILSNKKDSFEKEMEIEKENFRQKTEELKRQNKTYDVILKDLDEQYLEAQKTGDIKKMDSIKKSQNSITDSIKENNKSIEILQENHQLKIATIQEKWAKDEISKAKEKYDLEKTERETAFLEELNRDDLSAKERQKRKEQFNKEEIAKEEEFLKSLIAKLNDIIKGTKIEGVDVKLLSPEQVEYFAQEAAKLGLTLQQLIDKKNELAGRGTDFDILSGVGTDIFGFSPEQWESTFTSLDTTAEKLQAVETVFGGLQNAWSSFSAFLDANDKKELKNIDKNTAAKKRKLKQDLDNGIINKVQYNKAIEKLDLEKDKKIAEIEYKKAKRDRIASLATIAIQTAIGISKAVAASPLTGGMPWTAIIGAIGALQAATVLATPLPAKGYEQGLYPDYVEREQDKKRFKARYGGKTKSGMVTKPTYFLAGENYKPEMVIDNKAYRDLSPYTRNLLINELRGIKGFENGYYNPQTMRVEVPATQTSESPFTSNVSSELLVSIIAENTSVMKELKDLKESGVIAYISKDYREMKKLQEQLDKYKALKEKQRQ